MQACLASREDARCYDVGPDEFARAMERVMAHGASVLGGCCGTTPAHIERLAALAAGRTPVPRACRPAFVVTSAQKAVVMPEGERGFALIGERINPTGKKRLKQALREGDFDYLVGEAAAQQEAGADVLDVNVGLPELDEPATLRAAVEALQAAGTLPLQVDSSDPAAIEAAVRGYAGKPLVNSVSGEQESLRAVLPVVKRYGCAVVGLTLDEDGIPPTAEGRFALAERIVEAAEACGIPRCDVAIDCLVMAAATNQDEVPEILRAVTMVKERLGVRTVLGVSNVSFGLPQRDVVNATFLAAALGAGLDLPIMNPLSARYRDVVAAFRVLDGQDRGAVGYVEMYAQAEDPCLVAARGGAPSGGADGRGGMAGGGAEATRAPAPLPVAGERRADARAAATASQVAVTPALADAVEDVRALVRLILTGRSAPMAEATRALLVGHDALDVVNGVFVPALDIVGDKYERGEFFLPQLMASAEAVKAGFDEVRVSRQARGGEGEGGAASGQAVLLATVEGDVHDIGKNIVHMLLENYGFAVVDLGRDVAPEAIVAAVRERGIRLVGLSALMTTTVKAMERTIALLREQAPGVAVMVGSAVLTPGYAQRIGADFYAKDAAESARVVARFFGEGGR